MSKKILIPKLAFWRSYSSLKPSAGQKLDKLRATFSNIDALVVPSEDAHQSEYTAECDNRRAWLSEFTGSAGCAVVTKNKAALFTDGRYFLQASKQLDKRHWDLMKQGTPGVPTWQEYLIKDLPPNSNIGIDPSIITIGDAEKLGKELNTKGSKLVFLDRNPVDDIRDDRPSRPAGPIKIHPIQYAGKSVKSKLRELREASQGRNMIITALDEIAWLFNLRGSDIHCCPVFFSYAIVTKDTSTLYIQSSVSITNELQSHLEESGVQLKDYDQILPDLSRYSDSEQPFIVNSTSTNMSIFQALKNNVVIENGASYIANTKAIKNESELNGIRNCHKRDAVALCKHFSWLSQALNSKTNITEYEAATHLESMRQLDPTYVGPSFDTIASTGPNGAIIHYSPDAQNSSIINPKRVYLCDSGAQYIDGTTDVTRTYMFDGDPSEFQKRAFTRVLQSHISVDQARFPHGTTGFQLDAIARLPLWKDGLDFRHGVGHGVGAYLNVHEGPHGIGSRQSYHETPLQPGMLVTNEPGYYQDGEFGIRIENILTVRRVSTPFKFDSKGYLGFEHLTFVPLGKRLMEPNLLSSSDELWINKYHEECRNFLEPLLSREKDGRTLSWIERETEPLF